MTSQRSPHLHRVRTEISGKVIQRSAPRVHSPECHGMWEKMGKCLRKFSALMVWKFTPEQQQDPGKVTEYLWGEFCGNSREEQLIEVCWVLFIGDSLILDSTLGGGGENQWHCGHSKWAEPERQPGAVGPVQKEKEIQDQISLHSERWRGSTTGRRGRARDNHLIPVPDWDVRFKISATSLVSP